MTANGWRIADEKALAEQAGKAAAVKGILANLKSCVQEVKVRPKYSSLQPHLIAVGSNQFSVFAACRSANSHSRKTQL